MKHEGILLGLANSYNGFQRVDTLFVNRATLDILTIIPCLPPTPLSMLSEFRDHLQTVKQQH